MTKDRCVNCGVETIYDENTNIYEMNYYVEGAGQLCQKCHKAIYKVNEE